jgi:hypothetical protein
MSALHAIHPQCYACPVRHSLSAHKTLGSADLQYSRGLYDGRLSLPLSKFGGLFPVRIHASKPLPVLVKHGDLPVLVLTPPIFSELGAFPCGFGFGHGLNISMEIRARKYQFGQYFARKQIILQYRIGCNEQRHCTRKRPRPTQENHWTLGKYLFCNYSLRNEIHKKNIKIPSRPADKPLTPSQIIYRSSSQFFVFFKKGKFCVLMGFGCHRNANEHDHKFEILSPPIAASDE